MEVSNGIWVFTNLFTAEKCREWIELCEAQGFDEAPINVGLGKTQIRKDIRNNTRVIIDDEILAFEIWQAVREHLPKVLNGRVALGLNERFRFYRYEPGQKFAFHMDGYFRRENGEQSMLTFMIYLNEDFEGGETTFMNGDGTIIKPETGMILVFNHTLFHEGSEVTSGKKYVLRSDVMFSR